MSLDANHGWISREQRVLAVSAQRTGDPTFGPVLVRGQGSRVWDANGRQYFDLTCGYSAANFGHAFAPLIATAERQLATLTHVTGMPHPGRAELAERIVQYCASRRSDKVLFNTSGSRAVETAIKAAIAFRPGRVVSIGPAYHGRSWFTSLLSETASVKHPAWQQTMGQWLIRRPLDEFAYCAACPAALSYPSCQMACMDSLVDWIEAEHASISAIIAEPAVGARGYIAPPVGYWQRLREITQRYGIVLIADEIQMGLGRCGHWLLSHAQGWQADLTVLGKSLGGGMTPISAVVGRQEIMDALPSGCESETFAASPLGTAIACEVMQQLAHGPWMPRAAQLGNRLSSALAAHADQTKAFRIETLGASATLEFFDRQRSVSASAASARATAETMVRSGLLVHYSGPLATRIVLLPALTISDQELAEVVEILQSSLARS